MEEQKRLDEAHGDHWQMVMDPQDFLAEHLQRVVNTAKLWRRGRASVSVNEVGAPQADTEVVLMQHDQGCGVSVVIPLARPPKGDAWSLMSFYPVPRGIPMYVTVTEVYPWSNGLEAYVTCELSDERVLTFFAADYGVRTDLYLPGHRILIEYAALGTALQKPEKDSIVYEGESANDMRSKFGQEPEFGPDGSPAPMVISLKHLTAYIGAYDSDPSLYQFQSPVLSEGGRVFKPAGSFYGEDLVSCQLYLEYDSDYPGKGPFLPLYAKREGLPDLSPGDPLTGLIWLVCTASDSSAL